jgi:hypothetical protein
VNGATGASGSSGTSGTSGTTGTSGTSGSSGTRGTSGTSGVNGATGAAGSSGTSGTSGTTGTSGTSGTSGTTGTSGTSGTAGTSGLQGDAGTSGTSGSSGVSGGGGGSLSIYDEGALVETSVVGIDFQGSCINAVDGASPGEVIVTIGTQYLIASHSGAFIEDNSGAYWYGDKDCGWDGCNLDANTKLTRESSDPIAAGAVFGGIPIPFDLLPGDELTVCGSAYLSGGTSVPDNWDLGVGVGYFRCSDYTVLDDEFPVTSLFTNAVGNSESQSRIVCFNFTHSIGDTYPRCDTHLVLGFKGIGITGAHTTGSGVRFTYTLNVNRGCS